MDKIAVGTDRNRKLPVKDLLLRGKGELRIRTVDPNQPQAEIPVYLVRDDKTYLLKKIPLSGLRPQKDGFSHLHCYFSVQGRSLHCRIRHIRRWVYDDKFSLVPPALKRRNGFIAGAVAFLLILLLLLFFFLRGQSVVIAPSENGTVKGTAQSNFSENNQSESSASDGSNPETDSLSTEGDNRGTNFPDVEKEADSVQSNSDEKDNSSAVSIADDNPPEPADLPPEGLILTVYFEPERFRLTPPALSALKELIAQWSGWSQASLLITGHCALYGTEEGRLALSDSRAEEVLKWLVQNSSVEAENLQSSGRGIQEVVTRESGKQNLNRRVEIYLQP